MINYWRKTLLGNIVVIKIKRKKLIERKKTRLQFCPLSFSAEQCQMLAIELLADDDLRGRRNDYKIFRISILI